MKIQTMLLAIAVTISQVGYAMDDVRNTALYSITQKDGYAVFKDLPAMLNAEKFSVAHADLLTQTDCSSKLALNSDETRPHIISLVESKNTELLAIHTQFFSELKDITRMSKLVEALSFYHIDVLDILKTLD